MKLKGKNIIWSLLILVLISSFLWAYSLIKAVENGHAMQSQLADINRLGLNYILYKRLNSFSDENSEWLNIAKVLAKGDGDIAFSIAKYYQSSQSGIKSREVKLWLMQAIRLNHKQARILLANIYLNKYKYQAAKEVLLPIKSDPFALKLLIEISLHTDEHEKLALYIRQFKEITLVKTSNELQAFSKKLDNFILRGKTSNIYDNKCLATIAPFTTDLTNLNYFNKLISSKKLTPLKPYLCFSPVKYISKKKLGCQHNAKEAIRCNEDIWNNNHHLANINNRFVAILVDKGGANVNAGILYIDRKDNDEVFMHELLHLLGFIDEYALPKRHFRCLTAQTTMFSHNIAVLPRFYQGSKKSAREKILKSLPWAAYISNQTPLVHHSRQGWKLGTKDIVGIKTTRIGAFIAETCSDKDFVAVKPLGEPTSLRNFENNLPALYLQFLKDNPEKFLMPSYKENVLKALQAKK